MRARSLLLAGALITAFGVGTAALTSEEYPTIVAVGDISPTRIGAQKATSNLALKLAPDAVLTLGDNQYESGALSAFKAYYHPTWGRLKDKTYPAPGNHDPYGSGYKSYFGARAPSAWRAFRIGAWLILQLDSNASMASGSKQHAFVKNQLAANTSTKCVMAYWHHPRFSSSSNHGSNPKSGPIWTLLYSRRADVVLNGHDHTYERFSLKRPDGSVAADGIREFVSGLGGKSRYPFGSALRGSQKRWNSNYGVLEMTLKPDGYAWKFHSISGAVVDQGESQCV